MDGLVGDPRTLPARTPFALTMSDLRPRRIRLDADTPRLSADPECARPIRAIGAHSLIVAPLKLRGAVLGLVSPYRDRGSEPYDEYDVSLALTAAAHVALSIDNARRFERDHVIASTVHRRRLPQRESSHVAVDTAHVLLPGRNSGCWFDTISLSGARTALVVGMSRGTVSRRSSPWASCVRSFMRWPVPTSNPTRSWPGSAEHRLAADMYSPPAAAMVSLLASTDPVACLPTGEEDDWHYPVRGVP